MKPEPLCKSLFNIFNFTIFAFHSIERWDFYQEYINTVVEMVKNNTKPLEGDKAAVDTTFEACHEFLCEVGHGGDYIYMF